MAPRCLQVGSAQTDPNNDDNYDSILPSAEAWNRGKLPNPASSHAASLLPPPPRAQPAPTNRAAETTPATTPPPVPFPRVPRFPATPALFLNQLPQGCLQPCRRNGPCNPSEWGNGRSGPNPRSGLVRSLGAFQRKEEATKTNGESRFRLLALLACPRRPTG